MAKTGIEGRWIVVKDNDSHTYIIPEGKTEEFDAWVASMEGINDDYKGPDYGDCSLGSHLSCYVLIGKIEEI